MDAIRKRVKWKGSDGRRGSGGRGLRFVPAALALLLAACGGGMSGTYKDEMGMNRLTFHGNGTVVQYVEMTGVEKELKYEIDGDKVRIQMPDAPGATTVLTRIDDQTLSGPMGVKFHRQ